MMTTAQRMLLNLRLQRSRGRYMAVMADNGMAPCPHCSNKDRDVYHPKNFCTATLRPVSLIARTG